ncbi:glycosyltransferase family 2 protein [Campylobacter hominis]|uniref:Putative glycosyltransferase n=1 Tax=Campylobacter hominis (strain ATCC BAA-381 / DSM 21671 / CCUG 45161 / LMG 19568 / NCTC 13146 / CH001A) TaxID=360107 RepID=A7I3C4_CAMHC|nr:glycosyltransferase family 2 protein [Campylobacter hominis]ABS51827.1 putative glycosyltransferase [Campylobacter hominis ATCC BAA-381]UAK85765.1 glycosyltransferase [Campylobacter hominis]SUW85522.1 putative glycosyltransferase [Campylobacter hominis]
MSNPLVSIIVPVYNVENFIEKCATTLFEQDYDNIEYIFVNDCTPDGSISVLKEIIEKYPNRKSGIQIINKEKNEGLPQARKTGLKNSNGEYIMHVDSDDWVELDMVSSLIGEAIKTDADMVICDYYINYSKKEIYKKTFPISNLSSDDIIIKTLTLEILSSMCCKLVRKEIYSKVIFPVFSNREDMFVNLQFYSIIKKYSYLNRAFYHYNKANDSSITQNYENNKNINDLRDFYIVTKNFLQDNSLSESIRYLNIGLCYSIVSISNGNSKKLFDAICPSANNIKYIWKNNSLSFIKKIVFSLPFLHLEWLYVIIKKFYKTTKGRMYD